MATADPLDDVFTIEDRFYTQGYEAGLADGESAGRAEGRSLGMSKGFEKFCESSRLAARAVIWANRFPSASRAIDTISAAEHDSASGATQASHMLSSASTTSRRSGLPPLVDNARLEKNVKSVYALVEPGTLSTKNEDEAVQDFDDRLRRAQGKVKVVERMIGGGNAPGNVAGTGGTYTTESS
jgi:hypothetical protein